MNLQTGKRLLSLVTALVLHNGRNPAQIPYIPQKTESFYGRYSARSFPRAMPEEVGIPSATVEAYLRELEESRVTNINSLLILVDGKVICDASAGAYRSDTVHLSHSLSKTLVAIAYGFLTAEGLLSLDDKLVDFFPEYKKTFGGKMKAVTLRHLLTMGVALSFNEKDSLLSENWTEDYLDTALKEEAGQVFSYNSMSSFMLSSVLTRVTGESMLDYLRPRLWEPLEIENVFWEANPEGVTKGGWGLYLSPEDMLKLGLLLLQKGEYRGKRILSADYVAEMTAPHQKTPDKFGSYDYGYQVWVDSVRGNILFNGMLGQNILVLPKANAVIVLTAGNSELFQHSQMLEITERCFADRETAPPLPRNIRAYRSLRHKINTFCRDRAFAKPLPPEKPIAQFLRRLLGKTARPIPKEAWALDGKHLCFEPNNSGLLPLFVSVMQNNFSSGIRELAFSVEQERLYMTVKEGGERYRLEIGLYAPAYNDLTIRGERYILALLGSFRTNEDDVPLLKLDLTFPELPSAKHWKLYYGGEEITLLVSETPGYAIAEPYIDKLEEMKQGLLAIALAALPLDLIKSKARAAFSPILHGSHAPAALPKAEPVPLAAEEAPLLTEASEDTSRVG